MPSLRITAFGGQQPRTDPRLLSDNGATVATNVDLHSGTIRPLNAPHVVLQTDSPVTAFLATDQSGSLWKTWQKDVDVVRVPFSSDVESRFCWTGDGEPRTAKFSDIAAGQMYALGIPAPTEKPVVTTTGGTGTIVSRVYLVTFFSADGEESGPSPVSEIAFGRVDGAFNVVIVGGSPANSGVGTATYAAGETTFSNAATAPTWLRAGDEVVVSGATLVVTATPAAHQFKVSGDYSAATQWRRAAPWKTEGLKRRLYRSAGTTATFQLVAEDVGAFYADTLTDSQILGDDLISSGWEPAPAGLRGLCIHSSGALFGFVGNELWASEPLQPHAWLVDKLRTDYPIVGLAAFGSEIMAATTGTPYLATGVEPASMTITKIGQAHPCMSKRSVVSVVDGGAYASSYGLVFVGRDAQARVLTDALFTRDEWAPLRPETMACAYSNGRLYCSFSSTGSPLAEKIMVFAGEDGMIEAGIASFGMYAHSDNNELYFCSEDGVYLFDPSFTQPVVGEWASKEIVFPRPLNFGAAKIEFFPAIDPALRAAIIADRDAAIAANSVLLLSGDFGGSYGNEAFNSRPYNGSNEEFVEPEPVVNDITFSMVVDGETYFTRTVTSNQPFRLPSGKKYDNARFITSSHSTIREVRIAETAQGLAQV